MKVTAFNCSPRKDGNTAHMIGKVLEVLEGNGIETEFVQVGELKGCKACGACRRNRDMRCVQKGDDLDIYYRKMTESDGIIIGSPTYFSDLTAEAKALIDRCGYVNMGNGNPLRRKVGAALSPARRAGSIHVIDSITHFFTINEMYVVSSSYWNMSEARDPGDFEKDEEGIRTMTNLGENMAWILRKLE